MPTGTNKQFKLAKKDIPLLRQIFTNSEYSAHLYQLYYNQSTSKKEQDSFYNLYKSIVSELEQNNPDLQKLTTLIPELVTSSSVINEVSKQGEINDDYSIRNLKILTNAINNFTSGTFNYNGGIDKYAHVLVSEDPKLNSLVKDIEAYKIVADKLINKRDFSKQEIDTLKKYGITDYNNITIQQALNKLSSAYDSFRKHPSVLSSVKTNHLKTAGFHVNNNLKSFAIATGVGVLGFLSFMSNIPFQATDPAYVSQVFWTTLGLAGGVPILVTGGISTAINAANHAIFTRKGGVRDMMKNIKNKDLVFEKIAQLYQEKKNKVSHQDIINLEKEIQKLEGGKSFTFGNWFTRKRHFEYFVEASKLNSDNDLKYGYNIIDIVTKNILNNRIDKMNNMHVDRSKNLSGSLEVLQNISQNNPNVANILGLTNNNQLVYANKIVNTGVKKPEPAAVTSKSVSQPAPKNVTVKKVELEDTINSFIDTTGDDSVISSSISYSKNKTKALCAIQIKKMEYNKHQFTISEQEAKKIMDAVVQKLSRMKLNTNSDVTKVYLDEKKEKVVEVTLTPSEIKKVKKAKSVIKK